jgi:sortase A
MVIAALVGAAALVVGLRSTPPPAAPYTASAPPLQLPSDGSLPATPTGHVTLAAVRIEAPAGGIDLGLVEGDGVHVPLNLAAHYPGTAQPGDVGNAVYYAHAQPGMFQGLYRLHLGDEIRVLRQDGTQLIYHATAFEKVPFNDRAVLTPTPFGELTLLTCTSYDPYTPRFIVIATQA